MKAIVHTRYGPPEVLQIREISKPVPKDNEVLVKVHAASVNDWDWALVRGKPLLYRLFMGLSKPKFPILGVDVAGQVEAIGKNVKKFRPGDTVYGDLSEAGFGGFAEYVSAPENALSPIPDGLSFEKAAAMPHAALLALQGLRDIGQIRPGQSLLINGAGGGVGTIGVQLAKNVFEAGQVTGVDHSDKLDMMRSLGFDHLIDYTQEDFTRNGQQYDLILDAKTNRSPFKYIRSLKPNGAYVTVGGSLGRLLQMVILKAWMAMVHKKQMHLLVLKPNLGLEYLNKLISAGKVRPVIDGPFPFSEIPEAIRYFGSGKHQGKIIIRMEQDK